MVLAAIALLLGLDFLSAPARANGFKAIAGELSSAARDARIAHVAVMPFTAADDSGGQEGWHISERLVTQLVRTRRVKAVERSLLRKLLEEHALGRTGALDSATLKSLGRVLSAEGIITGSFVASGSRLVVNARLIHIESGVIAAACEQEVERSWFAETTLTAKGLFVPAPEFIVEAPVIVPEDDALADDAWPIRDCEDAPARVDRLEEEILDLKARYWALQLRKGLDPATLRVNPGSTITDRRIKREFYARLEAWSARGSIPELSPWEAKRFVKIDGKAYALYRQCGI